MEGLKELIDALALTPKEGKKWCEDMGKQMFVFFSEKGFPPDMFMAELEKRTSFTPEAKLLIVHNYLVSELAHKRASGISEERVEKIRVTNRRKLQEFLRTGEMGIY